MSVTVHCKACGISGETVERYEAYRIRGGRRAPFIAKQLTAVVTKRNPCADCSHIRAELTRLQAVAA